MFRFPIVLLSLALLTPVALADSAQLEIDARVYNPLEVTLAVVNRGPGVARNAVITVDIPPGPTLERLSGTTGPCDLSARPVRCAIGDVTVHPPGFYMSADFKAPFLDAMYDVTFTVTSETPDPQPTNNSVSVKFETKREADLGVLVMLGPFEDRVDPGEEAEFWAFVGNEVRNNETPTNVRVDFAVTNGTIEKMTHEKENATCTFSGAAGSCTAAEMPDVMFVRVVVRSTADRQAGGTTLAVQARSDVPERSTGNDRAEHMLPVYRWFAVTNTADSGPGSLREAITAANANCTPGPCRIVFEIPAPVPQEGWFTIMPLEPLPAITAARVTLEGARQTSFTGDTNPNGPEVAIDGRLARRGLKMLAQCEAVVDGFAIGNFDEDQGVLFSPGAPCADSNRPDARAVTRNHVGIDPSGATPWPNLRGIRADGASGFINNNVISHNTASGIWMWNGTIAIDRNRIEKNGASGIFLGPGVLRAWIRGNAINEQRQMGVAAARGIHRLDIRGNRMRDNGGLGIDWGLDGVSPANADDRDAASNAPVLLAAEYDAAEDRTRITLSLHSTALGTAINGGELAFFGNRTPDGDGETPIGFALVDPGTKGTVTITIRGDHRGKWINATWTRTNHEYYDEAITSELSNSIRIAAP